MSMGILYGSRIGVEPFAGNMAGIATYQMSALNRGFSGRFRALSTKDIKSVILDWYGVSVPGTVQLRIETDSSGKPSGTLYDANASYNITPAGGVQTYTFAVLPTTGLTVGSYYHIVLLTTVAGTSHNLNAYFADTKPAPYPVNTLTATDGTVRTNFAETSSSWPVLAFILDDDSVETLGMLPYYSFATSNIFGTSAVASKIALGQPVNIHAIDALNIIKTGTPAGDLRIRIYDSSDNLITNSTVTENLTIITNASPNGLIVSMPGIISLPAGTYRVMFDSPNSVNSSNCWAIRTCILLHSSFLTNFHLSTCTTSGGNPGTWTDSSTDQCPIGLRLDSFGTSGGGGGPVGNNIRGGFVN